MSEVLVSDDPEPSPADKASAVEGVPLNHILSAAETARYADWTRSNLGKKALFAVNHWFEIDSKKLDCPLLIGEYLSEAELNEVSRWLERNSSLISHDWKHVQSEDESRQAMAGRIISYAKTEVVYTSLDIDDYDATVPGVIVKSDNLVFLPAEDTSKIWLE